MGVIQSSLNSVIGQSINQSNDQSHSNENGSETDWSRLTQLRGYDEEKQMLYLELLLITQSINHPLVIRRLIGMQVTVNKYDQIDPSLSQTSPLIDHEDVAEMRNSLSSLPEYIQQSINQLIKRSSDVPEWFDRFSLHYSQVNQSVKPIQHVALIAMCVLMAKMFSDGQMINLDLPTIIAYHYDYVQPTDSTSDQSRIGTIIQSIAAHQHVNPVFYMWKTLMLNQPINASKTHGISFGLLDLPSTQSLEHSIHQSLNQSISPLVDSVRGEVCWSIPSLRMIEYILGLSDRLIDCFAGYGYWAMQFHIAGAHSVFAIDDMSEARNQTTDQSIDRSFDELMCHPVIDSSQVSIDVIISEQQHDAFQYHSLFFSWLRPVHKAALLACINAATTAPYIFLIAEGPTSPSTSSCMASKLSATGFLDDADLDEQVWQRVTDTPPMARWPGTYDQLYVWKRVG